MKNNYQQSLAKCYAFSNLLFLVAFLFAAVAHARSGAMPGQDWDRDFLVPPAALRPIPFWHINGLLRTDEIQVQMKDSRDKSGFGGVAVLPVRETLPEYLSADYFARYGDILKTGRELGMEVIMYDDNGFPSGSAGGKLKQIFPDDVIHRLDLTETNVQGPIDYSEKLHDGKLMGIVAMNPHTWQRIDITSSAFGGQLSWKAPAGSWKVMVFTCVPSRPLINGVFSKNHGWIGYSGLP